MAVPNVSEGRDAAVLDAIGAALTSAGARLLDVHSDAHHDRTVFTLAGGPRTLARGLAAGAKEAAARIEALRRSDTATDPRAHPADPTGPVMGAFVGCAWRGTRRASAWW